MPTIKLNVKSLEALKPDSTRQTDYFDRSLPGFGVRVSGKGKKSFIVLYRHAGRVRRLTLGSYPPLTLADARGLAREALRDAHLGGDPAARKKEERKAESFLDLADAYLERHAKPRKKSWPEDKRILHNKLVPAFGRLRAKDLTRADVRAFLDEIVRRPAPIEANRTLAVLRKMYNWGISQDLVDRNPCHGVSRPAVETRRDRVLSPVEIRAVWEQLDGLSPVSRCVLKLLLITAQRKTEVLSLRWEDIEGRWWTIPQGRSKNGLPHRVLLSDTAIAALTELTSAQQSQWVFPSPKGPGHVQSIQKAMDRVRVRSGVHFRAHDLRRTAASQMASIGVPRLTVSKILNHVEHGVTAVYDRHGYDHEKTTALEAWGRRLEQIVGQQPAGNIVPFARS